MTGLEVFPSHLVSFSRGLRKHWQGDFVGQLVKKKSKRAFYKLQSGIMRSSFLYKMHKMQRYCVLGIETNKDIILQRTYYNNVTFKESL